MFFWSQFPFVRITIAFCLGIITSVFLGGYQEIAFVYITIGSLFLIVSKFFNTSIFFKYNWAFGLTLVLLSFSIGYVRLFIESEPASIIPTEEIIAYQGLVISQPIQKGNFYKAVVEISKVKDSVWRPTTYRINLYLRTDSAHYAYGDIILVKGNPTELIPPQNPDEFNYKRYLSFLTIYQQHFTEPTSLQVISSDNGNVLIATSLKQRNLFSNLLDSYIKEPKERAIAKALLLGNKSELDDEIINTYAASGAMHVLAVSGLHVGIIYAIILWLFSLLPVHYQQKWLIAVVSIPLLWGYAFITGLSPSVLRAVTLFSIMAIGSSFNRRTNMVNLLAVSAFVLLVYKPYLLMQVGFQLSYVAVLGIIFIYPQIRKLWVPTHQVYIFFWDIVSISIAAQIATFPLSILFFHRFPPYFLISNLLVIPAATIIVGVGIAFFTLSSFTLITQWLGWLLGSIIGIVNYVLNFIYKLPWSNWDGIYLDVKQTWVLYFIIIFLFLFIISKNNYWAIYGSLTMMLFSFLVGYRWVHNNQQKQIIAYKISRHYAIDLIQAGELVSLMDSALINKPDKIHFHIKPNRLLTGASEQSFSNLAIRTTNYGTALVWNGVSTLIVDKYVEDEYPFDIVFSKQNPQRLILKEEWLPVKSLNKQGLLKFEL